MSTVPCTAKNNTSAKTYSTFAPSEESPHWSQHSNNPRWTSSLCDWHDDMDSCCEVTWCGICQMTNQYELLTNGIGKVNPFIVGGLLILDSALTWGWASKVFALHLRTETRRRYNITPDEDYEECCQWLWCTPCSVCQVHREMSARGEFPGLLCITTGPKKYPAPKPHAGMGRGIPVSTQQEQDCRNDSASASASDSEDTAAAEQNKKKQKGKQKGKQEVEVGEIVYPTKGAA